LDKYLVIIPARGGSKSVPKKNIKLLGDKPLIHYTIEVARKIFKDSDIYISTDSKEIKRVAEETGIHVPFLRPKELSTDNTSTRDVLLHSIDFYEKKNSFSPDIIVLLQPTSPFRKEFHVREAINLWEPGLDMVVSVKQTQANPYYTLFEENKKGFLTKSKESSFTRRQDCPNVWEVNGAVYIINVNSLKQEPISDFNKVVKYVMEELPSIDIDSQINFDFAQFILNKKNNKNE